MMKLFINSKPWQLNLPVSPLDEVNPGDDINNLIEKPVEKSYEFSTSGMKEETYRHVPVWTITENGEKICSLCLYKFNPDSLENKRKMVFARCIIPEEDFT